MSVFVDTGAWFASFVRRDPDHNLARKWVSNNNSQLITSDYILDELFTLLKLRESYTVAVAAGKILIEEKICQIIKITPDDFARAWNVFIQFSDKGWSFTDCTSKVIMERLNISTAFSFDEHFEQFGSIVRVP
ncbi:MAG: type II toxin-antitoxin system VapC family toxin [Thermodesulfobacteriota bacterium]|nr:type II toxin-antitoxin system VapC family toxin [Thermodesulfobacteriota bacterium]